MVWVDIVTAPLKSYSYSFSLVPSLLYLDRTRREGTPKRARGVMGRRKMKGRESPQASFSFLSSPLALSLTSLLSLVLMVD